jgi:thiol-disulfide isomerase/thioredoxin
MDLPESVKTAFSKARLPLYREKRPAPDFTLKLLNGSSVTLSRLRGKVVFLNFWATWCPPCRAEMPSMEALYQRFRDQDIEFLAVDIMEKDAAVAEFFRTYRLSFPAAIDSTSSVSGDYGIQAIPTTFVLDRDGKLILSAVGGRDWNSQAIISAFEELLRNGR